MQAGRVDGVILCGHQRTVPASFPRATTRASWQADLRPNPP